MRLTLAFAAVLAAAPLQADPLRIATFNAALNRAAPGDLADDLAAGDPQAEAVAATIRAVDPDIVLINEFDHDPAAAQIFADTLLEGLYPHRFTAPVNTGVPSGFDLDNDGRTDGPGDALGFGAFPGQYGMLLLSKHPILTDRVRTFRGFLWRDMPGARLPPDPEDRDGDADRRAWFTQAELAVQPLSSKSHWDVPIAVAGGVVHMLASHPTPPVFDGPEDRNGRRNADEIRLWADYVDGAGYMTDDDGVPGGLPAGAAFVILGDLNADPFDGDSLEGAVRQILDHPRVQGSATDPALTPASRGAVAAATVQGGANRTHRGDPAFDTADFGGQRAPDRAPGNVRVDYVLPSVAGLAVQGAGVFWPAPDHPDAALAGPGTSDHRLVWIDVVPGG